MKSDTANYLKENKFILALPLILAVPLTYLGLKNYLLFHVFSEAFPSMVAFLMTIIAIVTYKYTKNNFLLFLGIGYMWVGGIDTLHYIHYSGMGVFSEDHGAASTQTWIIARYVEALVLAISPRFIGSTKIPTLSISLIALLALTSTIAMYQGIFPDCYRPDQGGLTPFKIYSEYIIIGILLSALIHFYTKRKHLESDFYNHLMFSIILTMAAEFTFTLYFKLTSPYLIAGHLFKFYSFCLIFSAIAKKSIMIPYERMSLKTKIYDNIHDPILLLTKECKISHVNESALSLIKLPYNEVVGQDCHDIIHSKNVSKKDCSICNSILSNDITEDSYFEYKILNNWYSTRLSSLQTTTIEKNYLHHSHNISDLLSAKEEVYKNEAILESLIDSIPEIIFIKDENSRYLNMNQACLDYFQLDRKAIAGMNDIDLFGEKLGSFFRAMDKAMLEDKIPKRNKEVLTSPDGRAFLSETLKTPFYDNSKNVLGLIGICRDVSQEVHPEDKGSNEYKEHLTNIIESTNSIISMVELLLNSKLDEVQEDCLNVVKKSTLNIVSEMNKSFR